MSRAIAQRPLKIEHIGAAVMLTLDHPPSRNALSEDMLTALLTALDLAAVDKSVKAIVIGASGPAFYDDDAVFATYMAARQRRDTPDAIPARRSPEAVPPGLSTLRQARWSPMPGPASRPVPASTSRRMA